MPVDVLRGLMLAGIAACFVTAALLCSSVLATEVPVPAPDAAMSGEVSPPLGALLAPQPIQPKPDFDREIWRYDPVQSIADEIEKIPGENKLKYGVLIALTLIPQTTVTAGAAIKHSLIQDVIWATGHGLVNALNLSARERALAKARLAVLKGTWDWRGFLGQMAAIKGVEPATFLGTLPATVSSLLAGQEAMSTHSHVAGYLISVAQMMQAECEFDAAAEVYEEARRFLKESNKVYVRELAQAYAGLTRQKLPDAVVIEDLPRTLRPTDYPDFHFRVYAYPYLHWRNEYDAAGKYLEQIPELQKNLKRAAGAYPAERKAVHDKLRQAEQLLSQCRPEQGAPILAQVKGKYFIERFTRGPAIARNRGCFGWASREYNRISGNYYEFGSGMVLSRKRADELLAKGQAALKVCHMVDAEEQRFLLEQMLLRMDEYACARDQYVELKDELDDVKRHKLCEETPTDRLFYFETTRELSAGGLQPKAPLDAGAQSQAHLLSASVMLRYIDVDAARAYRSELKQRRDKRAALSVYALAAQDSRFDRRYDPDHIIEVRYGGQRRYRYYGHGGTQWGSGTIVAVEPGSHEAELIAYSEEGVLLRDTLGFEVRPSAPDLLEKIKNYRQRVTNDRARIAAAATDRDRLRESHNLYSSLSYLVHLELNFGAATPAELLPKMKELFAIAGQLRRGAYESSDPDGYFVSTIASLVERCWSIGNQEAFSLAQQMMQAAESASGGVRQDLHLRNMASGYGSLADLAIGSSNNVPAAREFLAKVLEWKKRTGELRDEQQVARERERWPRVWSAIVIPEQSPTPSGTGRPADLVPVPERPLR